MGYNTMVHTIISDYTELEKYVNQLPDLGAGFKYYISLFARKKYGGTPGLKSDKAQLKRFIASKDLIIKKLQQLEIPLGRYDIDGFVIHQSSLVVYISVNPRDMHKAGAATALELTKTIFEGCRIRNPQASFLSNMQTIGKKLYFNIDLDVLEGQVLSENDLREWLMSIVNIDACTIVQTRGGYHILVLLDKISKPYKSHWYNNFKLGQTHNEMIERGRVFTIDMSNGDGMTPLPGCTQGGFTPKLL